MNSYQQRKLSERCTHSGCSSPPSEDHLMCAVHRDMKNARNAASQRKWRRRARRLGVCGYCPAARPTKLESGQKMCLVCRIRRRKVVGTLQDDNIRSARAAEMTRKHADGRTRYHGQGKRGQQPRAQLDRQDLDDALKRVAAAKEALAYLETESARQLPRIQLRNARDAALAEIDLGRRTLEEVLDRGGYKVPVTTDIED